MAKRDFNLRRLPLSRFFQVVIAAAATSVRRRCQRVWSNGATDSTACASCHCATNC